ncbi:MAG: hypothetical protein ACFNYD_08615, partial [Bacteroides sp.]
GRLGGKSGEPGGKSGRAEGGVGGQLSARPYRTHLLPRGRRNRIGTFTGTLFSPVLLLYLFRSP